MLLTLPVSVASGDCSFSNSNLPKPTWALQCVKGLATLSIENVAQTLSNEIVSDFSELKAGKYLNNSLFSYTTNYYKSFFFFL